MRNNLLTSKNSIGTLTSPKESGIALVIVLAMLVLLSGLVIAFFSSVTTERSAAQSATASITAKQIAESTTNLVMAQIRDATSQSDAGLAWSSQPGAIRLFGQNASTNQVYKLYSADKMIESEITYAPSSDSFWPQAFSDRQFGFVDLNEPARRIDGTFAYPIINPTAKRNVAGGVASASSPALVEGFDCVDYVDTKRSSLQLLPLNVKWLYVLRDGSIGTLDSLLDPKADTKKHPSKNNPIVGRTAFWTDDEAAKINVNTASEPTYWDTPYVSTLHEIGDVDGSSKVTTVNNSMNLAVAQPVQGEYQRYPGHPATTALSPVMRRLLVTTPNRPDIAFKDLIYQLAPRIYSGGGQASDLSSAAATINKSTGAYNLLPDDGDRLFSSVDEYMFRGPRRTLSSGALLESSTVLPVLDPAVLDRIRCFLTANSRSPELNLFGRPRIAVWPIPKDPALRTYFDNGFAFTSTLWPAEKDGQKDVNKQKQFYFTRVVSATPTNSGSRDATLDFYGKAGSLFGSTPPPAASASGTRNEQLYVYLQKLAAAQIPGYGGSFASKFGADKDQILTEIFDYIRCTSLVDGTGRTNSGGQNTKVIPATPYSVPYDSSNNVTVEGSNLLRPNQWSGQVIPIKIGNTQGLGRFITLREAALGLYVPLTRWDGTPVATAATKDAADTARAVMTFEFVTPMGGYLGLRDTFSYKITEITPLNINGLPAFPTNVSSLTNPKLLGYSIGEVDAFHRDSSSNAGRPHNTGRGFNMSMMQWTNGAGTDSAFTWKAFSKSGQLAAPDRTVYPFMSIDVPIAKAATTTLTLQGGQYSMDLYAGLDPTKPEMKVQTITFELAPHSVTVPKPWMSGSASTWKGRNFAGVLTADDVVRSVELSATPNRGDVSGDYRTSAATAVVPKEYFDIREGGQLGGTNDWDNVSSRVVHGLQWGHGDPFSIGAPASTKANSSHFAANSTLRSNKPPDLPDGLNGVKYRAGGAGDWDRGISKHPDGALANKPDDGNINFRGGALTDVTRLPYMRGPSAQILDDTNFSPNRLIPSPVMLGSLPTGVQRRLPWQTLLFRPDRPAPGEASHPGATTPPDHLMLDFFWMPVVEPYAISEPSATAGKVNMNFAMAPFSYLQNGASTNPYVIRDTAMRAVLKGVKLMAVPSTMPAAGHREGNGGSDTDSSSGLATGGLGPTVRFDIDPERTLKDFSDRFADPHQFFKSASEICEMDLYPYGSANPSLGIFDAYSGSIPTSKAAWGSFWATNNLTGDNCRERPYAMIYPRVTTKSNVFSIHMRSEVISVPQSYYNGTGAELNLQALKDDFAKRGDVAVVSSEYRGSTIIERYIDPNDPALGNYVDSSKTPAAEDPTKGAGGSLDPYYRFRVVNTKRFVP